MALREHNPVLAVSLARPAWLRYATAVALTAVVSLTAHEFDPYWDLSGRHPYLIEWPTIIAAAWFGGLGPGLLAVALSDLAIVFFWVEPAHSLAVRRPTDLVAVALFALCGIAVSVLIERLHLARRRERDLRRAREVLLGVVAHDLRNPLNSIAGCLSLARRNQGAARAFDIAERAVSRMDCLIRDLVDASRIEADETLPMVFGSELLAPLLEDAVSAVRFRASARSIEMATEVAGTLRVVCDRARLLQVLGNLLDNALKFTPEGGRITLGAMRVGALVRVEVTDSGPGIKPEQQAQVFTCYWSGGGEGSGTGLGLFIAHGIVRAHGGRLSVHSEPGHGTTFFLTLPALDDAAPVIDWRAREDSERFRLS